MQGDKEFHAYNSSVDWLRENVRTNQLELEMSTRMECSQDAVELHQKILEAEILRDVSILEVVRNFGFSVNNYESLKLFIDRRVFWSSTSQRGQHKCVGSDCARCKVCNTRSSSHTVQEFIEYRSKLQSKETTVNLDLATQHRCGSDDPSEVEFVEKCYLKSLQRGRTYESFRQPGVTITASGCWFICMSSGQLHFCRNDECCSNMTLEVHDGSAAFYSCALTGLAKKPVVETFQPWDGIHFHPVAEIRSIQNGIINKILSDLGNDEGFEGFEEGGLEEAAAEADTEELANTKQGDPEVDADRKANGTRKLEVFSRFEKAESSPSKKPKYTPYTDTETQIEDPSDPLEEPEVLESSESVAEEEQEPSEIPLQKRKREDQYSDFYCYQIPTYSVSEWTSILEEAAKKAILERQELDIIRSQHNQTAAWNHRLAYSSQKMDTVSAMTASIFRNIRREIRIERSKTKLQNQNSAVKRDIISSSGISQPISMSLEVGEENSCFVVSDRDFFSMNYQMTKEEKIESFLSKGTVEEARDIIQKLTSPALKSQIAFLIAEESAKRSNVYIADLLNRYDMPLMSIVSFWMENTTRLIGGPLNFSNIQVDVDYYAKVIVAHWREFVLADYMEQLLVERKKRKTKQMDFSLFSVGVLYSLATAGGVKVKHPCQDSSSIPELFVGTKIFNFLMKGVLITELPDCSAELGLALIAQNNLMYISQIYTRGYRYDSDTLADGKRVFRLCYNYRHRFAQNKLFARARQAVYSNEEEKVALAYSLYEDYLIDLIPPHTKAKCSRTDKA